jgi:hypothetical protein
MLDCAEDLVDNYPALMLDIDHLCKLWTEVCSVLTVVKEDPGPNIARNIGMMEGVADSCRMSSFDRRLVLTKDRKYIAVTNP